MTPADLLWWGLQNALWAGMASLGFAVLFNVPVRTLFACALGGAIGHTIRGLLMMAGAGIEESTLAGAATVGALGWLFARLWQAPAPVFAIPGVIPMVPGSFAFRTMIGLLLLSKGGAADNPNLLLETSVNGAKTALILAAIAVGIAIPTLLSRRHRPLI